MMYQSLVLALKAKNKLVPLYLLALTKQLVTSCPLRESSITHLEPQLLKRRGRLLSGLDPLWWNKRPLVIRTVETLAVFKCHLKTHLFKVHLRD